MTCTLRLPDMASSRLASCGLITSGSLCGSLRWYTSAARSCRRSVTRNRNLTPVMIRLRLQMLSPLSTRCSWKRRTSSAVAVSGERSRNAAKRLQLWMWLLCAWRPNLRAAISSHILDHTLAQRADGGISAHGELLLSEVAPTPHLPQDGAPHTPAITALSTRYRPRQRAPPRSGYRGSDLVH